MFKNIPFEIFILIYYIINFTTNYNVQLYNEIYYKNENLFHKCF